jgi:hypothetical protein
MARFKDYETTREIADIMEGILDKHPRVFPGFDMNKIGFVHTLGKKAKKNPIKIRAVRYPYDVWMSQTYIVEVMDESWKEMTDKKKRCLAVFHTMCAIPEGAFDEQSENYAKIRKPDYEMYAEEFAVSGGVPNWMDNEDARDPMEVGSAVIASVEAVTAAKAAAAAAPKKTKRVAVTVDTLVSDSSTEESVEKESSEAEVEVS